MVFLVFWSLSKVDVVNFRKKIIQSCNLLLKIQKFIIFFLNFQKFTTPTLETLHTYIITIGTFLLLRILFVKYISHFFLNNKGLFTLLAATATVGLTAADLLNNYLEKNIQLIIVTIYFYQKFQRFFLIFKAVFQKSH